jgi:uncharacterized protein (DUF302 family)
MDDWGRRLVVDAAFDRVVSTALEEFEREGFEVSGRLDLRDALWHALGEECRRYTILTVWHPVVAARALRHSLDIGVELPINVAVYELADEETAITVAEPLPSLRDDRAWRDDCPELLPIELQLSDHLAHALGRLSRRLRAPVPAAQR